MSDRVDIDQNLEWWHAQLATGSQNLMALAELTTYERLTGDKGFQKIKFTGLSKETFSHLNQSMSEVWRIFGLLSEHIDLASKWRGSGPLWLLTEKALHEIDRLLYESSLELKLPETSLSDRDLLTESEKHFTATEALDLIKKKFTENRNAVLSIDALWSQLPLDLGVLESELNRLLEAPNFEPERLKKLSLLLSELRASIESDPVGVREKIATVFTPELDQLQDSVQQNDLQLRADVRRDRKMIDFLREICRRSEDAFLQAQEKVLHPAGIKVPPANKINDLSRWLDELERAIAKGYLKPVQIGLQKWRKVAEQLTSMGNESLEANLRPVEERAELRGRFKALQAKALASAQSGGALAASIRETEDKIEKLLSSQKTPLEEVTDLLTKYGALLSGKGADKPKK